MEIKNKMEIELSVKDVEQIMYEYFQKVYGYVPGEYVFDFRVVNKPYPCGMHDSCDRYEFDGIKIIVTQQVN